MGPCQRTRQPTCACRPPACCFSTLFLPAPGGSRDKPQQLRHIPSEAYAQHADVDGGRVVVEEVQVCCMEGRQQGGYYAVHDSLSLLEA